MSQPADISDRAATIAAMRTTYSAEPPKNRVSAAGGEHRPDDQSTGHLTTNLRYLRVCPCYDQRPGQVLLRRQQQDRMEEEHESPQQSNGRKLPRTERTTSDCLERKYRNSGKRRRPNDQTGSLSVAL